MKGERLPAGRHSLAFGGVKVALQMTGRPTPIKTIRSAMRRFIVQDDGPSRAPTLKLRHLSLVIALLLLVGSFGYAQAPTPTPDPEFPTFRVQVWGYIAADFSERIWRYSELRSELEKGLPGLRVTEDVREIRRAQRALAKKNPRGP